MSLQGSSLRRPLMIGAAFLIGWCFPQLSALKFLMRYILMTMLVLIFLKLRTEEFRLRRSHIKILLFNLIFPCALWFLLQKCGKSELAAAAFFTAVTPTASSAPVIISFLDGSVPYVVTGFGVTTLGVALALPVLLPPLITGQSGLAGFAAVVLELCCLVGIPVIVSFLLRRFVPKAEAAAGKLKEFSFLLWVILLTIIAASASNFIRGNGAPLRFLWETALLSLLVCAVNFIAGYWLGEKEFRREASQSLGQKNTSFTIVLAATFASPATALGPTFYVVWHNLWNALQLFWHDKSRTTPMNDQESHPEISKEQQTGFQSKKD